MKHTLRIQLRVCEGAALRTLGLIERRGFRVDTITMTEAQGDGQALEVVVSGDRSPDLLQRQVERLHDVSWVEQPGKGSSQDDRQSNRGGVSARNGTMRPIHGAR